MGINSVVLSIGSNMSDGELIIAKAIEKLKQTFFVQAISNIYQTKAINGKDEDYFNCVIAIQTDMSFMKMKNFLKELEKHFGRNEDSKSRGMVELDIDIVIFNKEIVKEQDYKRNYFLIGYNQVMNI